MSTIEGRITDHEQYNKLKTKNSKKKENSIDKGYTGKSQPKKKKTSTRDIDDAKRFKKRPLRSPSKEKCDSKELENKIKVASEPPIKEFKFKEPKITNIPSKAKQKEVGTADIGTQTTPPFKVQLDSLFNSRYITCDSTIQRRRNSSSIRNNMSDLAFRRFSNESYMSSSGISPRSSISSTLTALSSIDSTYVFKNEIKDDIFYATEYAVNSTEDSQFPLHDLEKTYEDTILKTIKELNYLSCSSDSNLEENKNIWPTIPICCKPN